MLIVPIAPNDACKRKHTVQYIVERLSVDITYRFVYQWRASLIETWSNQSALIVIVQFAQRHGAQSSQVLTPPVLAINSIRFCTDTEFTLNFHLIRKCRARFEWDFPCAFFPLSPSLSIFKWIYLFIGDD